MDSFAENLCLLAHTLEDRIALEHLRRMFIGTGTNKNTAFYFAQRDAVRNNSLGTHIYWIKLEDLIREHDLPYMAVLSKEVVESGNDVVNAAIALSQTSSENSRPMDDWDVPFEQLVMELLCTSDSSDALDQFSEGVYALEQKLGLIFCNCPQVGVKE